jgi:hypothetical protein
LFKINILASSGKVFFLKVQRTVIFVAMINFARFEGAAHRNIKCNVTVRCTFKLDFARFCYKYYGALHLLT